MRVMALDHVNIHTARLDETVRFYVDGLGLERGRTPPGLMANAAGGMQGAWLCDASGRAILHVIGAIDDTKATPAPIDHFALNCIDRDGFIARLSEEKIAFEVADYPQFGVRQLVVHDPNGIKIELGFQPEPGWPGETAT